MIEITNRQRGPIPVMVRSSTAPRTFTVKNIPGIGKGKNVVLLEDFRRTPNLNRLEEDGFVTIREVPNQ